MADEIEAKVTKKLEGWRQRSKCPGSAPVTPLSVVRRGLRPSAWRSIKTALDEGARQAIEGNDLKLASQPKVDIGRMKKIRT